MILLGVDWTNVSGGNLLVALSIILAVFVLWRASPIGSEAVESWKNLAEGRKAELDEAIADAKRRFDQLEAEKAHSQELKIQLAKCQEQPKTEELAHAVKRLADSFDAAASSSASDFNTHRGELAQIMTRLAEGQSQIMRMLERDHEALGSMHQALVVLVDRNRANRAADAEGRDPPLST